MKSLAAVLLLTATANAVSLKSSSRIQQLVESLSQTTQSGGHTCQSAISRLKSANVNYTSIIGSGVKFTDSSFSFTGDAMYWTDYPFNSLSSRYSAFVYDRARNKLPTSSLFGTDLKSTADEIAQGEVGDCYYLASASALAEIPSRIQKAFVTQTYNNEGIIVVRGYVLGKPTDIVIDDYIPFYSWGVPAFAKNSPSGGLWGPFLEKAWAKANGNYEMVEGGSASEALRFLTGAPTITYFKDSRGPSASSVFYNTSS